MIWYMFCIDLYIPPPVWPTYDLVHVLHCDLYIPLEFILFCGVLSRNWFHMVLHVRNCMFTSILLNRSVTLNMSGLRFVYVIHFLHVFV